MRYARLLSLPDWVKNFPFFWLLLLRCSTLFPSLILQGVQAGLRTFCKVKKVRWNLGLARIGNPKVNLTKLWLMTFEVSQTFWTLCIPAFLFFPCSKALHKCLEGRNVLNRDVCLSGRVIFHDDNHIDWRKMNRLVMTMPSKLRLRENLRLSL